MSAPSNEFARRNRNADQLPATIKEKRWLEHVQRTYPALLAPKIGKDALTVDETPAQRAAADNRVKLERLDIGLFLPSAYAGPSDLRAHALYEIKTAALNRWQGWPMKGFDWTRLEIAEARYGIEPLLVLMTQDLSDQLYTFVTVREARALRVPAALRYEGNAGRDRYGHVLPVGALAGPRWRSMEDDRPIVEKRSRPELLPRRRSDLHVLLADGSLTLDAFDPTEGALAAAEPTYSIAWRDQPPTDRQLDELRRLADVLREPVRLMTSRAGASWMIAELRARVDALVDF